MKIIEAKPVWNDLERSIHEPARLAVVTKLCGEAAGLGFQELKQHCGLTDGNLSRHLKVLEEAGIVKLSKAGRGRKAHTRVRMTPEGREAFSRYLLSLEKILNSAMDALEQNVPAAASQLSLALS